MAPQLASLVFIAVVIGLFWLDRDRDVKTSKALWIPVIWVWLSASRSVAEWLSIIGLAPAPNITESYVDGSPADRNVFTALMLVGLIIVLRRKQLWTTLRANAPILAFLAFAALSALWSDYPDITIKRWFKELGDLVMVLVVLTEHDWYSAIKRVMVRAGFLIIPHCVLVIRYYPAIGRAYNRWTWMVSFVGVATSKNELGRDCMIFGIVFIWCLFEAYRERSMRHRWRHIGAHVLVLGMVVWLFIIADSATAEVCFLLATVFIVVSGSRALVQKRWAIHALVALLIAIPFSTIFLGAGGTGLVGRDATLTGRTDMWQEVLAVSGNPWVGTGFESFWLGKRLEILQGPRHGLNESHNGYLEIYLTLGWIGVALLATLILSGYKNVMMTFERNPKGARLRTAYFLAVVVTSFTEAGFRTLSPSWITFLLATIALPAAAAACVEERSRIPGGLFRLSKDRRVPSATAAMASVTRARAD